eukprot:8107819-Pyramimonas_sp.AAC.1
MGRPSTLLRASDGKGADPMAIGTHDGKDADLMAIACFSADCNEYCLGDPTVFISARIAARPNSI